MHWLPYTLLDQLLGQLRTAAAEGTSAPLSPAAQKTLKQVETALSDYLAWARVSSQRVLA